MIVKTRSEEYNYIGLQLLNRRLPEIHEMKELIRSKMHMALAGINGEVRVDGVFNKYSFPFEYVVLSDVSLESFGKFQIDTVFLTQYFALILESKNIGGELSFKLNPTLLERVNEEGKVDVFESPEVQIERNIYLLDEWMKQSGVSIPIYGVIVLTNSRVRVIEPPTKYTAILHQTIPVYLRNIPREKKYITTKEIHLLSEKIITNHEPYFPYPMCSRWGIHPNDLHSGVCCEKCGVFGMEKRKNGWNCICCGYVDRFAHEKAVREWFVLIGETLNNRQCRKFLHLDSPQSALRILNSMNLVRSGIGKNTIYTWKWR
ncbi:Nuclease-related domain-containing protein [Psychrobacillus sp. OK028]|uniref:nuclease-related domain-containing protein n=1 Tax=Psychrobacillus sp. OK028 TaxID=1884359 RepID=UPI000885DFD8|nr:nuclease-related domain-containing protein [Psychrobacillus sp. OK028]SDN70871.1 Nuclease-related domain-containing protein [Psychrobacillus sp. OK028]